MWKNCPTSGLASWGKEVCLSVPQPHQSSFWPHWLITALFCSTWKAWGTERDLPCPLQGGKCCQQVQQQLTVGGGIPGIIQGHPRYLSRLLQPEEMVSWQGRVWIHQTRYTWSCLAIPYVCVSSHPKRVPHLLPQRSLVICHYSYFK